MLARILSENYGLADVLLTPAPRGFVAETYYVDSESGRYFAKLVKISRDSEILEQSLPVLLALRKLGIEVINYPISTLDGRLSLPVGNQLLVLFNYIAGQTDDHFPLEPYVKVLAQVHELSNQIRVPLPSETFDLEFKNDLIEQLHRLGAGTFDQPQERALQAWVIERYEAILRDLSLLEATLEPLRAAKMPIVLTHGDAAGNVVYDDGQLSVIDWDTVLFAPRERDTWFHRHTPGFLDLYRTFVPGYKFDPTAYRFYLYKRYLEDMVGFIDKILSPDGSTADKIHNLSELYKTCDDWLRPLMEIERTGF
ncbi:MAG: phosphotransferase [Chloroflexota bacterium]